MLFALMCAAFSGGGKKKTLTQLMKDDSSISSDSDLTAIRAGSVLRFDVQKKLDKLIRICQQRRIEEHSHSSRNIQ